MHNILRDIIGNIDWLNIDWRVDKASQVALELEPKSFSDCVEQEDEEGDIDGLLLFLCECLDLLDFFLCLKEFEEANLQVDEEEDDRCLLFCFDL